MSQVDTSDPRFMIKLIPAEEALKSIPRDILLTKIVDLHRRLTGKEPLLKCEGGWTEEGAKLTMEDIEKEFNELPKGENSVELFFGEI